LITEIVPSNFLSRKYLDDYDRELNEEEIKLLKEHKIILSIAIL
jgi:hypothetical protein